MVDFFVFFSIISKNIFKKKNVMKQQIIHIGGGVAKENYDSYLDFVEQIEFDPYKEKSIFWTKTLEKDLWEDFEYIKIPMPNSDFADYQAWKIMFEKILPYLKQDFVILGHSIGADFLLKYLDELPLSFGHLPPYPKGYERGRLAEKVKHIFLLAPAFEDNEQEVLGTFKFSTNLQQFDKNFWKITTFLHSKDDFVVPFEDFQKFKNILKNPKFIQYEDKNHFLVERFPEFLEMLRGDNKEKYEDKNEKFDIWNILKQNLDGKDKKIFFKEREIWYVSLWENIWFEQNGKGKDFLRPVLVLKKFNNNIFYGIPLTSKNKSSKFYFPFEFKKWITSSAILSQMKLFDSKRLYRRIWMISKGFYVELQKQIKELLFTK